MDTESISKNNWLENVLSTYRLEGTLATIADKIFNSERITFDEGVYLYQHASLGLAGSLANYIREKKHGDIAYFNKNFHIEPTNVCVFDCKFCAYSRLLKQRDEGWELTGEEILDKVRAYKDKPITEVHIVGGVHPKMNLDYFCDVITKIKDIRPDIHVKAFTAVELEYMFRKAGVTVDEGLRKLADHGMDSIPGGGAEIFDKEIREKICADKATTDQWLEIHETAHKIGMPSNATILYGHIESYEHRIHHMQLLRESQDRIHGFNAFIPLKYRNGDNQMSHLNEVSVVEDLLNFAVSRIYLDNFEHIKAYWPMIGRQTAQNSLAFGVDDIDGTIDDSTKIYSMAGAEEQNPVMKTREIVKLISEVGRRPVERNTVYEVIKDYTDHVFEDEQDTISVN